LLTGQPYEEEEKKITGYSTTETTTETNNK
jgi:hypothetical protein